MDSQYHPKFRRIGAGFCGTVWASSSKGSAFKREDGKEDGGPARSLQNDFDVHQRVLHGFSKLKTIKAS